jgi:hypothetical protein
MQILRYAKDDRGYVANLGNGKPEHHSIELE